MVLKGKGKLVASDPTSGVTTKASASRRGEKRRRGLGDEAEPPPSLPDAKRPGGRCGCVPKTVDDYDLDNGCILAEARAGHEQQFPLGMPVLESLMRSKKPWEDADKLVPFVHFTRHVREITEACSSEKLRWTPEALLLLKGEAEVYLFDVFAVVIRLARDTLAQPIPWYGKNTRLTPEQEETVFALSCGTSGIPVYAHNMSYSDVKSRSMCLPGEYCQRFLVPRLGSNVGKIKIFFGNNLTSSEVKFSTLRENFRLIKGWHDFIKNNCIVEGNNYAFTFEEEKEGSPLSIRVDTLNGVLDSEYGQEQHQRPQRSREATIPLGYMAAVRRTASTLIPYLHFARMVADCCPSGSRVKRNKLLSLHEAAVEHLVSLYELVYQFAVNQAVANQFATGVMTPYISDSTKLTPEEEQAAISLSRDCAPGTRTYIRTILRSDKKRLEFQKKFTVNCLYPYLCSARCKVFADDNLMTPVEVNFRAMPKEGKAGFYGGWPRFMEINGIKIGDVCAFAFKEEKEEEVAPLSVRVRVLRATP